MSAYFILIYKEYREKKFSLFYR